MRSEKIRPEHLQRTAFVYVRQSSIAQVRHHEEGRRRQYDLEGYARTLGWTQVVVIDEDLGKSGASAAERTGFQRLVAEVSLGRVGAVFGLDVSRLARNNRDWYQLLDLCGLMNTLIVDAEGVYDPRQLNDRLLLGLKGTMSEAELGWIRQRAHEALLAKARRGALSQRLPVGYVHACDGRTEKHPDQRVQAAIRMIFEKFAECGSVRQTLLWIRQEQIAMPTITPEARWDEAVVWRLPVYSSVLALLTNPCYAGAFAYGRTKSRTVVTDGQAHQTRGHSRERGDWLVLLRDHHEPYISWETYERNQELIAQNAQMKGLTVRGAVRCGQSLVAGLLRCGHCGRRLHVAYSGHARIARYSCRGAALNHGEAPCIVFGGFRVDRAIEQEVLRVLAPGAIEAALASAETGGEQTVATRRALELELRAARYEADRARRQYDAAEPEHRLVTETLERRWNAALERVAALEQRLATLTAEASRQPPPADRATLLKLAKDFPRVWTDAAADMRTKKRIVRLVIEEIIAHLKADPAQIELIIHWKGGKHTRMVVSRNRTGEHRRCTDRAIVEVVRDLARSLPDAQIARVLNRLGYRTGAGNTWTQMRVTGLRTHHRIPVFDRAADREAVLTIDDAARLLGIGTATVRQMIVRGLLPATQPVRYAPWAIRREDLERDAVRRAVEALKRERALPRTASTEQLTLEDSHT